MDAGQRARAMPSRRLGATTRAPARAVVDWILAGVVVAVLVTSWTAVAGAADVDELRRRWIHHVESDARRLAPKRFEDAKKGIAYLEAAVRDGDARSIERRAAAAAKRLDALDEAMERVRRTWADLLERRARALAAGADTASATFREAENILESAARKLEAGRRKAAERQAAPLPEQYDRAYDEAVRHALVGAAREQLEWAVLQEASQFAPRSHVRARDAVARVERLLDTLPADDPRVQEAAEEARRLTLEHLYLLERLRATCVEETRPRLEGEIITWRDALVPTLELLGIAPHFENGPAEALQRLQVRTDALLRQRDALRRELAQQTALAESLQSVIDVLKVEVKDFEARVATLEPYRNEARLLEEIQARFTQADGKVIVEGRDIVLRLYGLHFEPGKAELPPESIPLLEKVVQTANQLARAQLIVEGHTDSQGREELNMELSRQRAEAVRRYLVEQAGLDARRVSSVGYGATRPIASNDTEEGRRLNRRIEIILSRPD